MALRTDAVIEIDELFFSYYSLEALHGISLGVRRGEMVGLLGPNGAGKSTTLKILAGILPTSRGKVHIAGYALPEQHLDAKKIVGYLPESPLLYECLSGALPSPLSSNESAASILPHLLGLIAMAMCINICFTDFHNGSWIFLTAPVGSLRAFARGVYWALWAPVVGLPHLVMLPVLIRFWNWKETALVTGFSLVVVSLYLGIEITLISGLPFSSSLDELRTTSKSIAIQFYWFIALAFPTILQGILFRYWWTALLSAIVLSVLTWLVVRWNLGSLEKEMRWKLHTMKMGQNRTFQVLD